MRLENEYVDDDDDVLIAFQFYYNFTYYLTTL